MTNPFGPHLFRSRSHVVKKLSSRRLNVFRSILDQNWLRASWLRTHAGQLMRHSQTTKGGRMASSANQSGMAVRLHIVNPTQRRPKGAVTR